MSKILELREKRANLWEKAKNFLETHRREDGTVSAEDTATYERMEADVVSLGNEIKRLEKQKEIDDELFKPTSDPIINTPSGRKPDSKTGLASDSYKRAFWDTLRNKHYVDVRNDLSVGADENGGILAPDEYERRLVEALEEENFFRKLATVITTSSGERTIPLVKSKGKAEWIDEGAAYPFSDDKFEQVTLGAYKLGTMIKISEELLNDSVFNIESYIAKEFGRRIGAAEEEAFIKGDGSKKPTGIFNAEADITTAKTAITFDEIMDLYYSLRAPYRSKAVWILNDATISAIRKLKDSNGNYIWQPSVREGEPDRILNRPYYTSVYAPTAADEGKKILAFGDFSYYWIADRQGRSFKRLNELYAPTGQVGFLASQRVDGKLILSEAVKVLALGEE